MQTVILPARAKRLTRAQRRAAAASNGTIVVAQPAPSTAIVAVPRRRRRNRGRRNRRGKIQNSFRSLEESVFKSHLLAPDVFGPFRQPRAGSSDRTGLGFDQSEFQIVGTATIGGVQGLQAGSAYITGGAYLAYATVASTITPLGVGSTQGASVQFPSSTQVADVNLTSCSIVAYYTGNPLNVQGEVIIGCTIPIASTATYASLYYYPGTIKMPLATLINKPFRMSMRKLSPTADDFVTVSAGQGDVDLPFIFTTGMANGGTLQVLITRTWEYRSTTVAGSVIPYERVGPNHSSDVAAFTDAKGDIADMDSPVTPAMPEAAGEGTFISRLGFSPGVALAAGGASALSMLAQRQISRLSGGSANRQGMPHDVYSAFANFAGPVSPLAGFG